MCVYMGRVARDNGWHVQRGEQMGDVDVGLWIGMENLANVTQRLMQGWKAHAVRQMASAVTVLHTAAVLEAQTPEVMIYW